MVEILVCGFRLSLVNFVVFFFIFFVDIDNLYLFFILVCFNKIKI